MVTLPTESRGASRGNVPCLTIRDAISLSSRFGLLCVAVSLSRCGTMPAPKPEARAEGMFLVSQYAMRFPSARASGLCGVALAWGRATHRSPRREPRECALLYDTRCVFPNGRWCRLANASAACEAHGRQGWLRSGTTQTEWPLWSTGQPPRTPADAGRSHGRGRDGCRWRRLPKTR